MNRKEAIEEMALGFLDPNMSKSSSFDEVIKVLLSTAKKYEVMVGYLIKAIETTPGTEGKVSFPDGKIDAYEEIYELLTEGD